MIYNNIKHDTVIAIAGTVGVGKSTLTKKLAEKLNFKTSFEVVDSNPYLEKYYHDFERYGFHLQIFFLAERFKAQKKIFEYGGGYIQDRTIYEDLEIFARMNFETGNMNQDDWNTYQELFEAMVYSPYFNDPDVVIYLESDLDDILSRIQKRGRDMELNTDKAYWQELHKRYNKWIDSFSSTRLLRININEYDVEDEQSIENLLMKVDNVLAFK